MKDLNIILIINEDEVSFFFPLQSGDEDGDFSPMRVSGHRNGVNFTLSPPPSPSLLGTKIFLQCRAGPR